MRKIIYIFPNASGKDAMGIKLSILSELQRCYRRFYVAEELHIRAEHDQIHCLPRDFS